MDPGEQQTKIDAPTTDKDETVGFDFSAIMNSLARLEKSSESFDTAKKALTLDKSNDKLLSQDTCNKEHNESTDDVNVPLEELPIETKEDLPAVILDNKQFDADEELVFEQRCKLYRFDTSDEEEGSQWKERGIGNLTIVRRSIGANFSYGILMRREKVFKLCANHFIHGDMKLKAHGKNNNSFLWSTTADLSESTPTCETLAVRFKTVEDATRFKEAFEGAVHDMNKERNTNNDNSPDLKEDENKRETIRHDSNEKKEDSEESTTNHATHNGNPQSDN